MKVFISTVNNYMFRPKAAIFRLSQLQFCSKSLVCIYIYIYIDIYTTLFEQIVIVIYMSYIYRHIYDTL